MNIQDIFYLLGSVFMVMGIVLLLSIVIILFYIKKKVTDIHHQIESKINQVTHMATHSGEFVASIGATLAETAVRGVKKLTAKRDK